jgi:hypothetical protein
VTQDRFLLVILIAIGVLVVFAVGLFFIRGGTQDYGLEEVPQGVLRNYVLALEKEDYQRAYGYLQDADLKPDFDYFRQAFLTKQLNPSRSAMQIGETKQSGEDVIVSVVVIRGSSGPFGNASRESTSALLVKDENGDWKIANLPYPYWGWDWYTTREDEPTRSPP